MAPVVTDIQTPVPPSELAILEAHLPYSYSLLRRCQFTHRPRGTSQHAHYLFASDPIPGLGATDNNSTGSDHGRTTTSSPRRHFAAAYVDLSKGPETEVFFYSTLQDHAADGDGDTTNDGDAETPLSLASLPEEEVDHVLDLIISLFRRVKEIAAAATAAAAAAAADDQGGRGGGLYTPHRPHGTMVGGLHEGTYQLLLKRRGVRSSYWNPHDVWLFRLDRLPGTTTTTTNTTGAAKEKEEDDAWEKLGLSSSSSSMRWDVVRREDVPLIASRTKIPKVEATLMSEPSVVVRDAEGTPVAWGFMGIAGTLSTLHVEVSFLSYHEILLSPSSPERRVLILYVCINRGGQEPYRGRGLAKAVAIKVLKEHSFGDDGWGE